MNGYLLVIDEQRYGARHLCWQSPEGVYLHVSLDGGTDELIREYLDRPQPKTPEDWARGAVERAGLVEDATSIHPNWWRTFNLIVAETVHAAIAADRDQREGAV